MRTAFFTSGKEVRIDRVIEGSEARHLQIYPGFVQVNYSPIGSETRNHGGITLPEHVAKLWLDGRIKIGDR